MPFERPTLDELVSRGEADVSTRLPGADSRLRRNNLGVLVRTQAGMTHGLHGHLAHLARQLFPWAAEGADLERHASLRGINRKAAVAASGQATVKGTDGTLVPAGRELRRADDVRYRVTADALISGGQATLTLVAAAGGGDGNAPAGVSLRFVSPITGANTVATVAAGGLAGGADPETDLQLRQRLLFHWAQPPRGGAVHDYVRWALEVPGVTRAYAYPERTGPGSVGVTFLMDDSPTGPLPTPDDVAAVQAHLDGLRPVTAQVLVFALTAAPLDFEISVTPDSDLVRAAVQAELADLIRREAEPEGVLLLSHVREAISTAAGETDHGLASPTADVPAAAGQILTLGDITWS